MRAPSARGPKSQRVHHARCRYRDGLLGDEVAENRLLPLESGLEGAGRYATDGYFLADLPELGGALFATRNPQTSGIEVVFAPDDGSPALSLPSGALALEALASAHAEPETASVVGLFFEVGAIDPEAPGLILRWRLDGRTPPDVAFPPVRRVRVFAPLAEPGSYLISGDDGPATGLWRLNFDAPPGARLELLAPPGVGLPAFRPLSGQIFDRSTVFQPAEDLVSDDGSFVLAVGPRSSSAASSLPTSPLYIIHTDGSDAANAVPLLDGRVVLDGTARLSPGGGSISFIDPAYQGQVVATRPGASVHPTCKLDTFGISGLLVGTDSAKTLIFPRGDGRTIACLDATHAELTVVDAETGARDVRATLKGPRGTFPAALVALTPNAQAAVMSYSGPTGRRLYLVALDGPVAVARLVAHDAPANESFVTFRP